MYKCIAYLRSMLVALTSTYYFCLFCYFFFFRKFIYFLMSMRAFGTCGSQKRSVGSPGTRVMKGCESLCEYWELNLGPWWKSHSSLNCTAISPVPCSFFWWNRISVCNLVCHQTNCSFPAPASWGLGLQAAISERHTSKAYPWTMYGCLILLELDNRSHIHTMVCPFTR